MLKKNARRPASLRLALPATSANLGPAFDAAALALNLYITIDARPDHAFSITATGRDQEICRSMENHLILATYREVLESAGQGVIPLALSIKNEIPIGKGCGSSAAARLAGIAWPTTLVVCDGTTPRSWARRHGGNIIRTTHRHAGWADLRLQE